MPDPITIRRARPDDREILTTICFEAFFGINSRHNFPPDFPNREVAAGLVEHLLHAPDMYSAVAEIGGRVVGSNFLWEGDHVAGVGPITVAPDAQGGVGRALMQDVIDYADRKRFPSVRLVQAAFNTTSMSLYTKLGFDVREPLVCMNGPALNLRIASHDVRTATLDDLDACADVCQRVHGHTRRGDFCGGIAMGSAKVVEQGGRIVGYTAGIGFMSHTVALENSGLMALIGAAEQFLGPGMLLPSRNSEVFRWCLANGLRVTQPLTLMSRGLYNEPRGAFLPSILY